MRDGTTTTRVMRCWAVILTIVGYATLLGAALMLYVQKGISAAQFGLFLSAGVEILCGNLACTWFHSSAQFVLIFTVLQLIIVPAQFITMLFAGMLVFAKPAPRYASRYFDLDDDAASSASFGLGVLIVSLIALLFQVGALVATFAQVLTLHHAAAEKEQRTMEKMQVKASKA